MLNIFILSLRYVRLLYIYFRSLNYPGPNTFHSPTNWILGQQMRNKPFAQQQQLSKNRRNNQEENKMRYNGVNGNANGSPPYGVMSFGGRGGYNSGGTSGSGSSSQAAQKSPASRASSKISYDSTGPHDERYYGTIIYISYMGKGVCKR